MSNQHGYGPPNGPDFQAPQGWQPSRQAYPQQGFSQHGFSPQQGWQAGPPAPPRPPARPPARRRPEWVLTAALVTAVALVLGLTAWWASRDQAREAAQVQASASASPPPPQYSTRGDEIAFSSSEGSGILRVNRHSREGGRLTVNLSVISTTGDLSFSFSGFDEAGRYIEPDYDSPDPSVVSGYADNGQTVTGNVSFQIPDGVFTLTMTNDAGESVTALQIR